MVLCMKVNGNMDKLLAKESFSIPMEIFTKVTGLITRLMDLVSIPM